MLASFFEFPQNLLIFGGMVAMASSFSTIPFLRNHRGVALNLSEVLDSSHDMEGSCHQHLALSHRLHSRRFHNNVVPSVKPSAAGNGLIMLLSSRADNLLVMKVSAGISSSMALETNLLPRGRDQLPWKDGYRNESDLDAGDGGRRECCRLLADGW